MRVLPRSLQIPLGRGSVGAALVALCLAGPPLVGQSTPVKLTAVTPLEGLSSGVVTAVLRDHAGVLVVRGERMPVGHEEKALVLVLELYPVF